MHGIISRPAGAPEWSQQARQRFKTEFEALYSGAETAGRTAILEEGMEWKTAEFNAQESEYLAGRRLTREECARAYHIPLPMVGILEHATFSNIKEQHKNLYQDSLGPWLAMIEQEIELQLLPEFADTARVYVEFNIQEKLAGSFDEQTQSLQSAVGRPWMTADEARARMNLPALGGDAARLVTPLNVLVGGMASPRDTAPKSKAAGELDLYNEELRQRHEQKWRQALMRHYRRQEAAIVSRIPEAAGKTMIRDIWWDETRWNEELYDDLLPLNVLTAMTWAEMAAGALGAEVSQDRMEGWLAEHTRIQSEYINGYTRDQLELALAEPDARDSVKQMFEEALTVWAAREAMTAVTGAMNFGAVEGAAAGGMRTKTWKTNSKNPRPSHMRMAGETVGIRDLFSNGMKWPGDPAGGAENNSNCACSVSFGRQI
jgi:hypothetical protein